MTATATALPGRPPSTQCTSHTHKHNKNQDHYPERAVVLPPDPLLIPGADPVRSAPAQVLRIPIRAARTPSVRIPPLESAGPA
jgi:hypothetical protein